MNDAPLNVLDLFRLDGRRALVTGGSKGLGRVMAMALAQAGADLVIVSRTAAESEAAAAEIRAATGRHAIAIAADVGNKNSSPAVSQHLERFIWTIP